MIASRRLIHKITHGKNHNHKGHKGTRRSDLTVSKPLCFFVSFVVKALCLGSYVLPGINQPRSNLLRQCDHVERLMLEQPPQDDHLCAQHVAF
jgi:hypothetical protein